jgi:hypothetical protein
MTKINRDKIEALLKLILKDFKAFETELIVRGRIIEGLEQQFQISDIKAVYKLMRENPAILKAMDEKYDGIQSTYRTLLDSMKSVDEFFQA